MDFAYSPKVEQLRERVRNFLDRYVIAHLARWHQDIERGVYPPMVLEELKPLAKTEGLWNLFLPTLPRDQPGTRLSNMEYAPLAEIMGRIHWAAEIFNCSAPDTGNMELLHLAASERQREQWLDPLLRGEIRSCFAMTEPDVASSDATNLQTLFRTDGDDYIINGRKWFITGAADPRCRIAIVLGVSDPEAQAHRRHSMVLVPMDTPGVTVVRNISVMHHVAGEGHCEVVFRNARVPRSNLLGEEGGGFALAQARLGPGRIHHCMRSIGQCELAIELMCERALERKVFGKYLHDFSNVAEWIARSRIEVEQARLLVLKTAWLIDQHSSHYARNEIAMIKALVPSLQTRVLDRAMQIFGAMGLSPDTPLAYLWTWGRALRIADGPDEVHLRAVARHEIKKAEANRGQTAAYFNLSRTTL
jgi:acyl-CoA dehydrogenase